MERKLIFFCNNYKLKEKNGVLIIEMYFVGFFYCVNDNSKVNLDVLQMMCCLLCHPQLVVFVNLRKQLGKGLITYYKTSGITCLQKHLDANHSTIYKRFQ